MADLSIQSGMIGVMQSAASSASRIAYHKKSAERFEFEKQVEARRQAKSGAEIEELQSRAEKNKAAAGLFSKMRGKVFMKNLSQLDPQAQSEFMRELAIGMLGDKENNYRIQQETVNNVKQSIGGGQK